MTVIRYLTKCTKCEREEYMDFSFGCFGGDPIDADSLNQRIAQDKERMRKTFICSQCKTLLCATSTKT